MKGLILAAGRGSRLLPISANRPKPALPVAGVPILARAVQALRDAGVGQIAVVTSAASEADLRDVTQDSGPLTFIRQDEALGTGHAVLAARAFLGDSPAVLYLGDNLFEDSLKPLLDALPGAQAVIGVKRVRNPQAYGVAVVEGGLLVRLEEKPRRPPSDLAACGVFAFQPQLLDHVAELLPSERGEIEFPQALTRLLERGGQVRVVEFSGFWSDAGTPADLLTANAHYLSRLVGRVSAPVHDTRITEAGGPVVIESGAAVRGSDLIGPLWIGPHARVHNARLGPFVSVGAHARIEGATLGNVLVDEFTRILSPGGPITRAIIGRHALVTAPTDTGPQLVIGDGSIMRC